MNTLEQEHRMICKKCQHIFDIKDAAVNYSSYGGVKMRNKVCPYCGGGFRAISPSSLLDKYLDVDNDPRYYDYSR